MIGRSVCNHLCRNVGADKESRILEQEKQVAAIIVEDPFPCAFNWQDGLVGEHCVLFFYGISTAVAGFILEMVAKMIA